MTLCIGAMARDGGQKCIVLCCDYKVSNDEFGSESQYKFQTVSDDLVCVFADWPGRAKEIIEHYRAYLAKEPLTLADMADQLFYPVLRLRSRLARAYIGRKLGVEYQEFLAKGAKWFGREQHKKYVTAAESQPLHVHFIVAGFVGDEPILWQFQGEDIERQPNYAMIGTGAYIAEPALHRREHDPNTPLTEALYNVYEAKRLSEIGSKVGKRTSMVVLRPREAGKKRICIQRVNEEGQNRLAELFEEYGPKLKIPVLVENALETSSWSVGLSDL